MKMKLSQLSRSFSFSSWGAFSSALMKKKLQQLAEASLSLLGGEHIIQAWLFKVNRVAALAISSKHSCITIVFCNKVCYKLPGASSRERL